MADLLLGFDNFGDDAEIDGGSWTLPIINVQDPRPGKYAKSADLTLASTQFRLNFGQNRTLRMLGMTATNLSSAGVYRITRYSDAFVTQAGITAWLPIPGYPAYDYDNRGVDLCHLYATDTVAFAVKWEFDDQTNPDPDGALKIGRQFHVETWVPPYNFGSGNAEGVDPNTVRTNSLGGTGHFIRRKPARRLRVPWDTVEDSELPDLRRIRSLCGIDKQVFVVPDPDDVANYNYRNFLATFKTPLENAFLPPDLASFAFDLIEAV